MALSPDVQSSSYNLYAQLNTLGTTHLEYALVKAGILREEDLIDLRTQKKQLEYFTDTQNPEDSTLRRCCHGPVWSTSLQFLSTERYTFPNLGYAEHSIASCSLACRLQN